MKEFSRSGGRIADPAQQRSQADRQERMRPEATVSERLKEAGRRPWWRRLFSTKSDRVGC
ncbi:MAG: hypothetical protein ABI572_00265 [Actinomycetota bacterium]